MNSDKIAMCECGQGPKVVGDLLHDITVLDRLNHDGNNIASLLFSHKGPIGQHTYIIIRDHTLFV